VRAAVVAHQGDILRGDIHQAVIELEAVVVLWAVAALEVLVILVVALADHSHTEDL
jgi:hypothetical protein